MQNLSNLFYSLSVTTWNQFLILMSYKTQFLLKIDVNTGNVSIIPKIKSMGFCRNICAFGDMLYLFEQTKNKKAIEYNLKNETEKIYEIKATVSDNETLGYWPTFGEDTFCLHSKESKNISIFDNKDKKWNQYTLATEGCVSLTEGGVIIDNNLYFLDQSLNCIYCYDRGKDVTAKIQIITKDVYSIAFWLSYNQENREVIMLCKRSNNNIAVMKGKKSNEAQIEFYETCSFTVNCEPEKAFVPVIWKKFLYLIPVYADFGLFVNLETGEYQELSGLSLISSRNYGTETNYAEGTILNGKYYTVHLSTGLLNCIDLETRKVEKKELLFNDNERNNFLTECLENNGIVLEGLVDLSDFIQYSIKDAN